MQSNNTEVSLLPSQLFELPCIGDDFLGVIHVGGAAMIQHGGPTHGDVHCDNGQTVNQSTK